MSLWKFFLFLKTSDVSADTLGMETRTEISDFEALVREIVLDNKDAMIRDIPLDIRERRCTVGDHHSLTPNEMDGETETQ